MCDCGVGDGTSEISDDVSERRSWVFLKNYPINEKKSICGRTKRGINDFCKYFLLSDHVKNKPAGGRRCDRYLAETDKSI